MNSMLFGAIAMASFIISLHFLRFWKTTKDRFFLFFAISFLVEACNRAILVIFLHETNEYEPLLYVLRLVSFLIILWAIIDKNWRKR